MDDPLALLGRLLSDARGELCGESRGVCDSMEGPASYGSWRIAKAEGGRLFGRPGDFARLGCTSDSSLVPTLVLMGVRKGFSPGMSP